MGMTGIVGSGAWGAALANAQARAGREVILWGRDRAAVEAMQHSRQCPALPGAVLRDGVRAVADSAALRDCDVILAVVPAQAMRPALAHVAHHFGPAVPVVICAKGIERGTQDFMSEVVRVAAPGHPPAILSGPSFAADVARGLPTAVTLAAEDAALAAGLAERLAAPGLRLYHSIDMRGVEIGGAAKNVLAIACGIVAGRGLGASAGAALVARGFAELMRFGRAFGARPETMMGLSGLGDLVLTCNSPQSRNFSLGVGLGEGRIKAGETGEKLAEGQFTAGVLVEMARQRGIDMPIAQSVDAILATSVGIDDAIELLLARPQKAE